jgi:hypothetical protein
MWNFTSEQATRRAETYLQMERKKDSQHKVKKSRASERAGGRLGSRLKEETTAEKKIILWLVITLSYSTNAGTDASVCQLHMFTYRHITVTY